MPGQVITCTRCHRRSAEAASALTQHCQGRTCPWWLCHACRKLVVEGKTK